jgi:putative transposase
MPRRKQKHQDTNCYHIYNRSIDSKPIFAKKESAERFQNLIFLYRFTDFSVSYSRFRRYSKEDRNKLIEKLQLKNDLLTELICFCIMPNHFHLLLRQEKEGGISKFTGNIQNSFVKYFNKKHRRAGPLFQGEFKSVLVENESQFLHLSRYIHLNPYSSGIAQTFDQLISYPHSSLPEYLNIKQGFCETKTVKSFFTKKESYKNFILDQAEYQKSLQEIKNHQLDHF